MTKRLRKGSNRALGSFFGCGLYMDNKKPAVAGYMGFLAFPENDFQDKPDCGIDHFEPFLDSL